MDNKLNYNKLYILLLINTQKSKKLPSEFNDVIGEPYQIVRFVKFYSGTRDNLAQNITPSINDPLKFRNSPFHICKIIN